MMGENANFFTGKTAFLQMTARNAADLSAERAPGNLSAHFIKSDLDISTTLGYIFQKLIHMT
ncbi:MAG: hypothetical protein IJV93_08635 [Lentisphaeria bacterium]|nr:hypothetical protein [Lentisphaeria bacterium]